MVDFVKKLKKKRFTCYLVRTIENTNRRCVGMVLTHYFNPSNLNLYENSLSTTFPNEFFTKICKWKELPLLFIFVLVICDF